MLVRVTYVFNTDQKMFETANADSETDVMVYINEAPSVEDGEDGSTIVNAIRIADRRHFTWMLSDRATVRSVAEVASRFAKLSPWR